MISNYVLEKNINEYIRRYAEYILKDPEYYKEDEGYKYQAVATFQKNFDLEESPMHKMLERSLADVHNLLQSGRYYPKTMLIDYAEQDPEFVRKELFNLLEGEKSVYERVDDFINNFNERFEKEDEQTYFDYRFVSFFLAAYRPEKYIHTKNNEFKAFAEMVGYDLKVVGSPGQRYKALFELAKITREVLKNNPEFIKVHKKITDNFEYKDSSLSWGTDDFIFNVAQRFGPMHGEEAKKAVKRNVEIQQNKVEELEDMLVDEDVVKEESKRSQEELKELIKNFKPTGKAYTEKQGTYKVRVDNAAQKERIKILEKYECQICGFSFEYTAQDGTRRKFAHADHIIDKKHGGTEEASNIWVLCPNCHAKKTLGAIRVDVKNKEVYENGKKIDFNPGHLKEFGW